MKKQSRNNLEYLINNLSDTKIKNLIELLENKKLTIKSNDYELIKKLTLTTTEIDFVKELIGDSFKINNPQSKSSCGCGVSFSL